MTSARRALLREMSAAWSELNTVLQIMGHASSQGIFGKGRRRTTVAERELRELIELELSDHE